MAYLYGAAEGDRILRRHSAVPQLGLSWGSVTCMVSSENRRASNKHVFLISLRIIRIISRPAASSQPRFRQTRMILSLQMKLLSSNSVT